MQAPQADGRVPLNRLTKNSDEAPGGVGLAHTNEVLFVHRSQPGGHL